MIKVNDAIRSRGSAIALKIIALLLIVGALCYVFIKWQFSTGLFATERKLRPLTVRTSYDDLFVIEVYENMTLRADDVTEIDGESISARFHHRLYWTKKKRDGEYGNIEPNAAAITDSKRDQHSTYNIIPLAIIDGVRYYRVDHKYLLWVADGYERYRWFKIRSLPSRSFADTPDELQTIATTLIRSGQWEWYLVFAQYLLNSDDAYTRQLTARYAAGRFYKRELEANANARIGKAQVIKHAAKLLRSNGPVDGFSSHESMLSFPQYPHSVAMGYGICRCDPRAILLNG